MAKTMHAYHAPLNRVHKKNPYAILGVQSTRKIKKISPTYPAHIEYLRNILKKIQRSANMKSLINKTLLHEITAIHQHASENKAMHHASLNPHEAVNPRSAELSELLELADADGLDHSIFYPYNHSFCELTEIDTEENTAAREFQNEPEELNSEYHESQKKRYSEKTDDVPAEDIEPHLDFLKCSEYSMDEKKASLITLDSPSFQPLLQIIRK